MSSPTGSVELASVTVHAAPSAQLMTGEDAVAIFNGRAVTVLEGRFLATDGQNYDTFVDAKIRVAPRESCCSWKGVRRFVRLAIPYLACLVIGGALEYAYERNKDNF